MEWINIEKKWHEMARRLQNAGAVVANDEVPTVRDDRGQSASAVKSVDPADHDEMDTRATA